MLKSLIVAATLLFIPSITYAKDCLTSDEWAVSMAAQGGTMVDKVELPDGSFIDVYGPFGINPPKYILFPFNSKGCAMLDVAPVVLTEQELRERTGIVVARD